VKKLLETVIVKRRTLCAAEKKPRQNRDSIPLSCPIQLPEPAGYYVYAYVDPEKHEPFYIGKGHKNRKRGTFFYNKLNKMLREGILPAIIVIKEGLTEEQAYLSEVDLIHLIGTRVDGTGPLCNVLKDRRGNLSGYTLAQGIKNGTAVKVWGDMFPSLIALAKDPRCKVNYETLRKRFNKGIPLEEAVIKHHGANMNMKPITCWGEEFPSRQALTDDPRCKVTLSTWRNRLKEGWTIEDAVSIPRVKPRRKSHRKGRPVECWGRKFKSLVELANDPECVVTYTQLLGRLACKWPPEKAASTPINEMAVETGRQARQQ